MKLSIVIPAYNEAKTIHLILNKVLAVVMDNGIDKEIIIVDDASTDETQGAIESFIDHVVDVNCPTVIRYNSVIKQQLEMCVSIFQ